jgi:ketosteroid isomerase-like protein
MTEEQDREDILKLHKDWWEANHRLDIPLMQSVYPSGMSYLMFNANGHPYFGIDEKSKLWKWYQGQLNIVAFPDAEIMRLTISGDMAWIGAEVIFPMAPAGDSGTGSATWEMQANPDDNRIRATEIYQRDDGDGNPVWKMWHFHASPLPAADEPRPGFGDTGRERGLGAGPGITPLRVTREGTWDDV